MSKNNDEKQLNEMSFYQIGRILGGHAPELEPPTHKVRHVHGNILIGPGQDVEKIVRGCWDKGKTDTFVHGLSLHEYSVGVLNVADDYPEWGHHRDVLYIHAGLNDGPPDWTAPWGDHNSLDAYINAIQALDFLVDTKQDVYIHCHGGVSRSSFILCLYLSWVYNENFDKIVDAVKNRYDRVNIHPKHIDLLPHLQQLLKVIPTSMCQLYWRDTIGSLV